ncbi:uncharacterized protein LOC127572743 isoform X1 [Pristis pectinata]|uniref:uncharacterized protein LOC127572743 isoform X1 n=1 Tax=Pristis pectinata TaxID=685728 RepID=UPI00223E7303|nr:uncharacterized protein LOC127572743 isoform X1 [Pristis pectinata]XP_051876290.1 uncharacterized protein LOC127572743 isoform X1 [Pristis pectinata]
MQKQVDALAIPAKTHLPLSAKRVNCLEVKETKTGSNKMKGAVSLQQDCLGRRPLNCINSPKMKEDTFVVNEVEKEENTGLFGNFKNDINPTEFESGAYLWSMLLKSYIENHNLPLIRHVMNDESLNKVQILGKSRFENLVNSFPDQLMVQYAEDVKACKELPNCIQQVLGNLRNGSLVFGVHTELLLLHLESTITNGKDAFSVQNE